MLDASAACAILLSLLLALTGALWLAAWGALVHVHRAAFVPGPPMRLGAVPGLPLLSRSARWPPSANPLETPRGVASAASRAPDPGNDFGDSNGAGDKWYQDGLRFSCTMCGNAAAALLRPQARRLALCSSLSGLEN